MDQLHQRSLESEEFGRKAARAVGCVSQLEVSGVKLRDVLLRNIQTDFKREFHFIFFAGKCISFTCLYSTCLHSFL